MPKTNKEAFLEEIEFNEDFGPFEKGTKVKFNDGMQEILEFYLRNKEGWDKSDAKKVADRMKINVIVGENGMGKTKLLSNIIHFFENCEDARDCNCEWLWDFKKSQEKVLKFSNSTEISFQKDWKSNKLKNMEIGYIFDDFFVGSDMICYSSNKNLLLILNNDHINLSFKKKLFYAILNSSFTVQSFNLFLSTFLKINLNDFTEYYLKLNFSSLEKLNIFFEKLTIDDIIELVSFPDLLKYKDNLEQKCNNYNKNKVEEINKIARSLKFSRNGHDYKINDIKNFLNVVYDKFCKTIGTVFSIDGKHIKWNTFTSFKILEKIGFIHETNLILKVNPVNFRKLFNINFEETVIDIDLLFGKEKKPFYHLSSGEKTILSRFIGTFQRIEELKEKGIKNFLILIDEPDLHLHLDWQRQYIQKLIDVFAEFLQENEGISLHFIIATHSPFILSDVSAENVILLQKGSDGKTIVTDWWGREFNDEEKYLEKKTGKGTFGANFVDLIRNGFFFDTKNLMGSFVEEVIDEVAQIEKDKIIKNKKVEDVSNIKKKIGDSFLRDNLLYFKKSKGDEKNKD